MAVLPGGDFLMVANRGPRRRVTLHPPHDPEFCNILLRSSDEGETWSDPVALPGTGTECAGLTVLRDGAVLLNQFRFRWYPDDVPPDRDEPELTSATELRRERFGSTELEHADGVTIGWARGGGDAVTYRGQDGRDFGAAVSVGCGPYGGGYGMRGAAVLADGTVLLPLSDAPRYRRIFAVRSTDGGRSWGVPEPVAEADDADYEEPAPLVLPDGTIILLLRENVSHTLHAVRSHDRGGSWSPPTPTGIAGYPAHLLRLPDGRIAAVVGQRTPPLRIALYVSHDARPVLGSGRDHGGRFGAPRSWLSDRGAVP